MSRRCWLDIGSNIEIFELLTLDLILGRPLFITICRFIKDACKNINV